MGAHTVLLLALVLPFSAFVECPGGREAPKEQLSISPNCCFESAVAGLVHTLEGEGFEVERLARCPYLDQCPQCGIYELDDCLVVLRQRASLETSVLGRCIRDAPQGD